jgi:hypothetical protein
MKIEVGNIYKNKITGKIVIVQAINGNKVSFSERAKPGQSTTRSFQDFMLKHKPA